MRVLVVLVVGAGAALALLASPDADAEVFWAVGLPNYNGAYEVSVALSNTGASPQTATVSNFAGVVATASIAPGDSEIVTLPDEIAGPGIGATAVYRIETTGDVTATQFMPITKVFTNDATQIIPEDGLGTAYVVLTYGKPTGGSPGIPPLVPPTTTGSEATYFTVLATQDGTDVTVTPSVATDAGVGTAPMAAGSPYTYTLNSYQALHVAASSNDLSGSRVTSTKPVAVYGGASCITIGSSACDHIEEIMRPDELLGTEYVVCSSEDFIPGTYDLIRLRTPDPPATVTVDPAPLSFPGGTISLPDGGWVEFQTESNVHITSDQKVMVAQYFGKNGASAGDPAYIVQTPTDRYEGKHTFYSPPDWENHVSFSAPIGATMQLDGVPVPAGTPVGSSGYACSIVGMSVGTHLGTSDQPTSVQVFGWGDYQSYWYVTLGLTQSVPPPPQPPQAAFGFSVGSGCVPEDPMFWDLSLPGSSPLVAWQWSMGDGAFPAGPSLTHPYASSGTYVVSLTVTDGKGLQDTAFQYVEVPADPNCPPQIAQVPDILWQEGIPFEVCATGTDPDGDALTFWADGLPDGMVALGAACWWWTYPVEGSYEMTLWLTDGASSDSTTFLLKVWKPVAHSPPDSDGDGVQDLSDLCASVDDRAQSDADGDGAGDACDEGLTLLTGTAGPADGFVTGLPPPDTDRDGVSDPSDNCVLTPNRSQADLDADGAGDPCDGDLDGDGVRQAGAGPLDNCPFLPNADQGDADRDGIGNACEDRSSGRNPTADRCGLACADGLAPTALGSRQDQETPWWQQRWVGPSSGGLALLAVAALVLWVVLRRRGERA